MLPKSMVGEVHTRVTTFRFCAHALPIAELHLK